MLWLLQVVAVADFIVVWSWNVQDFFTWAQRLKTALQVGRLISFHAQYLKGSTVILCSNASLSFWHILKVENVLFMAQLWNISVFYFFCLVKISKVLKLLICDPSCAGILIIVFIVSDICALQWVEGCATTICITFKYRGNCSEWFKAHTQSFPWTGNLICQVSNSKFERYVNSLTDSDLFWVSFVHLKRVHFFLLYFCVPHSTFFSNNSLASAPDSLWILVEESVSFCFCAIMVSYCPEKWFWGTEPHELATDAKYVYCSEVVELDCFLI